MAGAGSGCVRTRNLSGVKTTLRCPCARPKSSRVKINTGKFAKSVCFRFNSQD